MRKTNKSGKRSKGPGSILIKPSQELIIIGRGSGGRVWLANAGKGLTAKNIRELTELLPSYRPEVDGWEGFQ